VDAVDAEVATAGPGSCFLILTHRHDLDLAITREVLKRGDFGFCGLIGSATKRARFVRRLEEEGLDCSRLTCPIGLPGIAGKEPAVMAVGVVAQLLSR
jgi:xanthine dehydrogenase accessory factor